MLCASSFAARALTLTAKEEAAKKKLEEEAEAKVDGPVLPEVQTYIHLLVLIYLVDQGAKDQVCVRVCVCVFHFDDGCDSNVIGWVI